MSSMIEVVDKNLLVNKIETFEFRITFDWAVL